MRLRADLAVAGKHVITVEGLGNVDHPHPLQERLGKLHASQCVLGGNKNKKQTLIV
jgi:xanthine dehydrogenase iron-sulfur cluster and FAD-binding subunit A